MVNYSPVVSSNVAAVGYEADTETLYVQFKNGAQYAYASVPADEYEALLTAPSVGSYLNDNIKNVYSYRRV